MSSQIFQVAKLTEAQNSYLNRNADVFQNIRRLLVDVISSNMKSNRKKVPFPIERSQGACTSLIRGVPSRN